MVRRIRMTGEHARYMERRNAQMPDDGREILMDGMFAQYEETAVQAISEPDHTVVVDGTVTDVVSCEDLSEQDERVRQAMMKVNEEGLLKHKSEWALLMIAMNQTDKMPHFATPQSFVDYLRETLHMKDIPSESTISKMMGKTRGMFPTWSFSDTSDTLQVTRRVNIAKRFISAYRKNY